MKKATWTIASVLLFFAAIVIAAPAPDTAFAEVEQKIEREGHARVIVKLRTVRPLDSESKLSDVAVGLQRAEIARVQNDAIGRVRGTGSRVLRKFKSLPYLAMDVDKAGLSRLTAPGSPVDFIYPDRVLKPLLAESTYQVEADIAHEAGITGAGKTIVVIDTGAEKAHPFLAGKVIHEACFATNESGRPGACPNGKTSQIGNGAGAPCTFDSLSCYHGTHVSGIAVGSNTTMTGVAPGATLIPIQVFHAAGYCSPFSPCADASVSDVVAALEHVYDIRSDYPIAAVNMSLGGGLYADVCDAEYPLMTDAIVNLESMGIATIAAAGNNGDPAGITAPACISAAVSVGAVDQLDKVAFFSNGSSQVDILAPGTMITSSVPGGGYAAADGTSMATPHVAGAWAILREAQGPQPVGTELDFLKTTGLRVTDDRGATVVTLSRLRLGPAAGVVNPEPVASYVTPNSVSPGQDTTITVTGVGFVRSSVVIADGVSLPTTLVSDTELRAVLPASMLALPTTSISIVVESPPLGGGTSAPLTITVLHPEIAVSSTTAVTGETVTVTLTDGPGNARDWMVLVPVGAISRAWLKSVYVPAGQTGMTWNVAMPSTPGDYEIRLLENGGYKLLATSATITVTDGSGGPPGGAPTIDLSTTTIGTGETLTVTLTGGPGNDRDWMVLVPVGATSRAWLKSVYVPAGETGMTWNVAMPATPGDYEIRLLENGSYVLLATSATITVEEATGEPPGGAAPSIDLSATTIGTGETLTVTLSNGPGNNRDWMVLVPVGANSRGWLKSVYVPAGETGMTWNVAMPSTPGDYEIRLLENGGYKLLATSATITVTDGSGGPPGGAPTIDLSTTTIGTGETLTVTLTGGPGNDRDWMVLVPVGALSRAWLKSVYVPAGETGMTWNVAMPATPGDYEIRLLENGSYVLLATSATITATE